MSPKATSTGRFLSFAIRIAKREIRKYAGANTASGGGAAEGEVRAEGALDAGQRHLGGKDQGRLHLGPVKPVGDQTRIAALGR